METNPTNQTPCQDSACCEGACVPEAVAAPTFYCSIDCLPSEDGPILVSPHSARCIPDWDSAYWLRYEVSRGRSCLPGGGAWWRLPLWSEKETAEELAVSPVDAEIEAYAAQVIADELAKPIPPMQPLATHPDEDTALVLFVAGPENTLNGFVGIRRNGEYVLPQGDPIPSNYPIVEGWRYFTPEEAASGQDGIEAAAVKFEAAAASLRSISLLPRNVEAPVDSSEV